MSALKRLAGDTAIYGASSIVGRLLNYLLVPFYTKVLPPHDYGVVTELYAYAAFFNVLYTFGLETTYFRFATKTPQNKGAFFNTSVSIIFTISLGFSLLLALLATPIVNWLEYPGKEYFVYWFAIILAMDALLAIPFAKLRLNKRPVRFATAKLINIGLNIFLNLFLILWAPAILNGKYLEGLKPLISPWYNLDWTVEYVFVANLLANAALFLIIGGMLLAWRPKGQGTVLRPMLGYSFPLLFMGIAGVTNEMLSRAALKKLLPEGFYPGFTAQDVEGIFGAVYKLSIFMALVVQAFRYAAEPFFFSRAADKNSPQIFSQVMYWFVILGCLIYFGVSINLDWLAPILLRNPAYLTGLNAVPPLLLGNLFLGIYFNLSVWYKLTDQTRFGMYIAAGAAAFTITGNVLLVPMYGYMGSVYVTLAAYAAMCTVSYVLGHKYYPIPYKVNSALAYIFGAIVLTQVIKAIPINGFWPGVVVHVSLVFAAAAVVLGLERKKLRRLK